MRLLLVVISFFLFNSNVLAGSAYLKNIEIEGVVISPKFDKYNNTYTGDINIDTDEVEIKYELEDESSEVIIIGNDNLISKENVISIEVINGTSKQNYRIILNKNIDTKTTFNIIDVATDEENELVLIILVIFNLFIVIFIYKIMFKKKKKKSYK